MSTITAALVASAIVLVVLAYLIGRLNGWLSCYREHYVPTMQGWNRSNEKWTETLADWRRSHELNAELMRLLEERRAS